MEFRPRNCRRKVEAVYNLLEEIKAMGGVQADWLPPKIVVTSPAGKKHYVLFHRVKVHKGVVYLDIDSHENGPVYELKDDDSILDASRNKLKNNRNLKPVDLDLYASDV